MSFALHTGFYVGFFFVCHSVCLFFTWWSKSILAISAILSRPKNCSDLFQKRYWVVSFHVPMGLATFKLYSMIVNFVIFDKILFVFQNYDQVN